MSKPIVTPSHIFVWEKLSAFKVANGFSPSYSQMQESCHISKATLAKIYNELEAMGSIRRETGRRYSIETLVHPSQIHLSTV